MLIVHGETFELILIKPWGYTKLIAVGTDEYTLQQYVKEQIGFDIVIGEPDVITDEPYYIVKKKELDFVYAY